MESTPPAVLVVVLCLVVLLAGRSTPLPLPGDVTQSAAQLTTDRLLPSELTLSVLVNQMTLVKMLNASSTACSLRESFFCQSLAKEESGDPQLLASVVVFTHNLQTSRALLNTQASKATCKKA